jgi:hypothetical protein
MRWEQMTAEEREQLVAEQIMEGREAPYTTDLNVAWQIVEHLANKGEKTTGIHLFPHSQGCDAMIGPLYLAPGTVYARSAPEAICLAALWVSGVCLEDVHLNRF